MSSQVVWEAALGVLRERMSAPSFETWISPLSLVSIGEGQAVFETESTFNRDWVLKNYRQTLLEALTLATGEPNPPQLVLHVREPKPAAMEETVDAVLAEAPSRPWTPRTTQCNLNPRYTFEHFVVGQHNRFCNAAAMAVAESPATSYNPFFIYGGVGLGKTHLMQAIGHYVLQHHTQLTVLYVTAEQFTNDLIASLGSRDMKPFRDRYRKIDVLIIDDVQFLEGKERTQEEIFHTFNALHQAGKQIILSSDRSPKNLARLEDRLRSRFEWGLIADIQAPDLETRVAILQKKAEREGFMQKVPLTSDLFHAIAECFPNNIRELEGGLNKVVASALLDHGALDVTSIQRLLGGNQSSASLSLDRILETVAQYYHLKASDLKGPSRSKDVSHARQVAIYVLRQLTEVSFPKLGELMGGRKHTSILYAYEKVKEELELHPALEQQMKELMQRVRAV
jgi:chromosomal replication initiator protein